jgi:hypothetical protein
LGLAPSVDLIVASTLEGTANFFFSRAIVELAYTSVSTPFYRFNVVGSFC